MSIIDTFVVLLGLDTKDFKKESDKVSHELQKKREEAAETAKVFQEKGREGADFFKELAAGAAEFFGVALSVGGLVSFVHHTLEAEVATGRLAKMINVSGEELGVFANATRMFGGSAAEAEGSIKSLAMKVEILGTKIRGAKMAALAFSQIGLSEAQVKGKKVFDVLDMISEKLSAPGMTGIKAETYGERLGLGAAMIRMLRDRDKMQEMIALVRELGVATESELKDAEGLEETQAKLGIIGDSLGRTIMSLLVPALKEVGKWLTSLAMWAHQHPEAIKTAFIGIAAAMGVMALAALKAAIAMLPISLTVMSIAAAVGVLTAGFYLLYKEWDKWRKGMSTPLAGFFNALKEGWLAVRDQVMAVWAGIREVFVDELKGLKDVFDIIVGFFTGDTQKMEKAWDDLWRRMVDIVDIMIGTMIYLVVEGVKTMINELKKVGKDKLIQFALNTMSGENFLGKLTPLGGAVHGLKEATTGILGNNGAFSGPQGAHLTIQHMEVTAKTNDPQAFAEAVGEGITDDWGRLVRNFAMGQ